MIHDLKIWPTPFAAIADGSKRAEFRKNDRNFQVGDELCLKEDDGFGYYSGRSLRVQITHIQPGGAYGIPKGFAVLSFELLSNTVHEAREERGWKATP